MSSAAQDSQNKHESKSVPYRARGGKEGRGGLQPCLGTHVSRGSPCPSKMYLCGSVGHSLTVALSFSVHKIWGPDDVLCMPQW